MDTNIFNEAFDKLVKLSNTISMSNVYGFVIDNNFMCKHEIMFMITNFENVYDDYLTTEQKIKINNLYNKLIV